MKKKIIQNAELCHLSALELSFHSAYFVFSIIFSIIWITMSSSFNDRKLQKGTIDGLQGKLTKVFSRVKKSVDISLSLLIPHFFS